MGGDCGKAKQGPGASAAQTRPQRSAAYVLACLCACVATGVHANDLNTVTWEALASRPTLFDYPGSMKQSLRDAGVGLDVWLTQVYQGLTAAPVPEFWRYGGKIDAFFNVDLEKIAGWSGLSVALHQEAIWGRNMNNTAGMLSAVNVAMGWPSEGHDAATSLTVTQKFGERVSLTVGKFNNLFGGLRTPIKGGSGYENFMHIAPTAQYNGVTPGYTLGANLSVRTDPAIFNLSVQDARDATDSEVLRDPFDDGILYTGSVNFPVRIGGQDGNQVVRGIYSTQKAPSFYNSPQLLAVSPFSPTELKEKGWVVAYEFQQYLYRDTVDPQQYVGIFGYASLSSGNPNDLKSSYVAGITGTSFLPSRELDRWGLMYFRDNVDEDMKRSLIAAGVDIRDEYGWEVFYNFALVPWFRLTLDLQYIRPGQGGGGMATYVGVRNVIKF